MARSRVEASAAETEALKVLWASGPLPVREVASQLNRRKRKWAYNTVLTFLRRLKDKGYVKTVPVGAGHHYSAMVTAEQLIQQRLRATARELADGSLLTVAEALVRDRLLNAADRRRLRKALTAPSAVKRTGGKRRK